jgi:PAS domain S-box-containing protein
MQRSFDFLLGGGELGALTGAHDWASTSLGPPQEWPEILKTTLRLILTSNHPMFIWWGPDLTQFYNDAYCKTMGPERHPSALGQPGRECWGEIWDIIGPQIESVMAGGGATWHEDQLVPVTRHGQREDVWWTYGYSPIEDSSGVRGVLVVCNDVTSEHRHREELKKLNQQLVEEIQLRERKERQQALQLTLLDTLRSLTDPDEIALAAFALLGKHLQVPRIQYAEVYNNTGTFQILHAWQHAQLRGMTGLYGRLTEFGPEVIASLRKGQVVTLNDALADSRTASYTRGYGRLNARACMILPVLKQRQLVSMLILQKALPFEWESENQSLIEDVAERVWNAIEHARARARREAAEEALILERRAESERLGTLFRQAPGFMAILQGPKLVFEFANAAYLRLVGDRKLIGRPVREAFPEIEGQGFFELLDQVFTSAQPFSAKDLLVTFQNNPDAPSTSRYIDFIYQPIVDVTGVVSGIFVEGADATERHLAKAALEASEVRLKEGMAAARMAVWDFDLKTEQFNVSENTKAIFRATWSSISEVWKSMHPDDLNRLRAARDNAVRTRGSYEEVIRMRRPDDSILWLQVHGKVICDEHGHAKCIRGVAIDVTARKQAEEALLEADRHKNEFLAMLAHELRNPLAPISAAAQLLSTARYDEERVHRTSQIIARQVEHMTSLINDLLDVSRVTTGMVVLDKEPLDIKQVIAESVEQVRPFIETRRHQFAFQVTSAPAMVVGDRKRLVQVITNILQNAAKYTPEEGNLSLTVGIASNEATIGVSDNGVGIDRQLLPHVFELFTQEKRSSDRAQGGLGLGLSLVKSLVELHGGRVTAASEGGGRGSTFTIFLPLFAGDATTSPSLQQTSKSLPSLCSPLRLLVVDDNVDAATALAMLLEADGHQVEVENKALAALRRAEVEAHDVYLLDIGLPGINGIELARRLRSLPKTAGATLIAVTGYGHQYDKDTAIAAGFDHYFVKPADATKLAQLLAQIKPA